MTPDNRCPYSYIEEDNGFPHMTLTMCQLHPEKLWGMDEDECMACEFYEPAGNGEKIFPDFQSYFEYVRTKEELKNPEESRTLKVTFSREEYDKINQFALEKGLSLKDLVRTGLVMIGAL